MAEEPKNMKSYLEECWDSDGEEDNRGLQSCASPSPLVYQCLSRRTIEIKCTNQLGLPKNQTEFKLILHHIFSDSNLDSIQDRLRITRGYIVSIVLTTCDFLDNIYQNEILVLYKSPAMEQITEEVLAISWKIHKYSDVFNVVDRHQIPDHRDSEIIPISR